MDISVQQEMEQLGATYYDNKGVAEDALAILKRYDTNHVRLRLWNNPYDSSNGSYGGGGNDLATTINLAKRVASLGINFLLDFHYSDFWADPSTQITPKEWANLSFEDLEKAVYDFTYETLKQCDEHGVLPDSVQVGNEITNGLLWPVGKFENTKAMASLLRAGLTAVKDYNPNIRTILHLDWGGDNELYRKWFDSIADEQLPFDIIGLSYYPFWHGTLEQLTYNMNDISARYDKDIIIAETAFPFTMEPTITGSQLVNQEQASSIPYEVNKDGQAQFLLDLMNAIKSVNNGRGLGFYYWEPTWINVQQANWAKPAGIRYLGKEENSSNVWANLALFDYNGEAVPALQTIKNF